MKNQLALFHPVMMFMLLLAVGFLPTSTAWTATGRPLHRVLSPTTTTTTTTSTVLYDASEGEQHRSSSENNNNNKDDVDFKRKMALVRSLQMSYYKSTNFTHSSLDTSTGQIYDLPLWRVGWTELPGRSNMLHVHEPIYTNMFESILYNDKPWYIGHLYLPQGSRNLKKKKTTSAVEDINNKNDNDNDSAYRLKTWEEEIQEGDDDDKTFPRSAVIGTLLRIADYRRMEDGRLLLLVEALERFVVTHVQQELPYSIANVQLLPDTEEVDPNVWVTDSKEGEIRDARSLALAESFQRYHLYEYDENFELPIPNKKDLQTADIHGSMLTLVVPYVPLSKTADLAQLKDKPLDFEFATTDNGSSGGSNSDLETEEPIVELDMMAEEDSHHTLQVQDEQPCLEQQLLQGNILKDFKHPDESVMHLSLEELEYRVWIEINDFLKSTKTPVSPVLLGLLPEEGVEWPNNFHLRKIANGIASRTDLKHNFVQVSPLLPAHRRLRRLSFSATTLLENKPGMEGLRQQLLEIASTRARLSLILEKLESYNSIKVWGEFQ